jgi:hypothetical protein
MKHAQKTEPDEIDTKKELDFYNVRENRLKVFERDDYNYETQSGAFSVTSPIGKFVIITQHSKIRSFRQMVANEAFGRNMRSKNEPTILYAENTTA